MKPDWPRRVVGSGWPTRCTVASAHAHEGLNFRIERAGAGELPRFELKAKRTVDLRDVAGGGAVAAR